MDMDQVLQTFIAESTELLQEMEDRLLDIENTDDRIESINSIFRAAHTIKGSAGLFGLDGIVAFTHVAESVLDRIRDGQLELGEELVSLFLLCKDHIGKLVDNVAAGREAIDPDLAAAGQQLVDKLSIYLGKAQPQPTVNFPVEQADPHLEASGGGIVDSDNWHISLRFGRDALRNGMDPLSFLRYLGSLGEIIHIRTSWEALPAAEDMDPESCYMGYDIGFCSNADKALIESVFDFVHDDCDIHILPPHSRIDDFIRLIGDLPEEELRLGEILLACGSLTSRELEAILASQQGAEAGTDAGVARRPIGEIAVGLKMVEPAVISAALDKQDKNRKAVARQKQSIRVDADKLDHLVELVGELVIAGAGVGIVARRGGSSAMQEAASTMARLVEEVRDGALNLRMVEIGETFNRFQRVVRDVSKELGKDIELRISGGDTELDKTVVEKIGDPLTHLVRNSIDHGIEAPEVRTQHGKPATGVLRLNAYHESGSIVIDVADDGGGLDRDLILAKAIEKGLVEPGQTLSDREIYRLIFEAGFSTAAQVSNLSGRGVGMDVVRRNIEDLRGSIELDSVPGKGTTTRIRLPLTLAIIDGFLMGVGNASYVVPLDMVVECIELTEAERRASLGRNFINLRGEALPFIRLREHFRETGKAGKRENIVVVKYGSQKAGLVVDALLGESQTVIKPLSPLFSNLKGISGSTILGSGEVALILDAPTLIQRAIQFESHAALPEDLATESR